MNPASAFYVYVIFRVDGTPCYVGKGKGDRWIRHEGRAKHYNKHLGSIIDQARNAGTELPKVQIRTGLTEPQAFEIERAMIAVIGREANGGPLVNLTDGGDGPSGYKPTPEALARQSAIRKGRKHTPEHCANISAGLKNRPKSPKRVVAASTKKRKPPSHGWWSTEEGRAKQKANNKGHTDHHHSDEARGKIKVARSRQPRIVDPKTLFRPGSTPWNSGMKGFNPSPATQFKPGHQPSLETRTRLSASITASWAKRKATASLSQPLT